MKKHILIVDDEESIRELLSIFLTGAGFRATTVASLAAALDAVRQDPPDLIISDLQLEGADGLETIARLKNAVPDKPVILLTGVLFDPKAVNEVLMSKVTCYLPKTCSLTQIMDAVRRLTQETGA
jgi:DNA-binding NtrC family response regulator